MQKEFIALILKTFFLSENKNFQPKILAADCINYNINITYINKPQLKYYSESKEILPQQELERTEHN